MVGQPDSVAKHRIPDFEIIGHILLECVTPLDRVEEMVPERSITQEFSESENQARRQCGAQGVVIAVVDERALGS